MFVDLLHSNLALQACIFMQHFEFKSQGDLGECSVLCLASLARSEPRGF